MQGDHKVNLLSIIELEQRPTGTSVIGSRRFLTGTLVILPAQRPTERFIMKCDPLLTIQLISENKINKKMICVFTMIISVSDLL